jgi:hypothetical protein
MHVANIAWAVLCGCCVGVVWVLCGYCVGGGEEEDQNLTILHVHIHAVMTKQSPHLWGHTTPSHTNPPTCVVIQLPRTQSPHLCDHTTPSQSRSTALVPSPSNCTETTQCIASRPYRSHCPHELCIPSPPGRQHGMNGQSTLPTHEGKYTGQHIANTRRGIHRSGWMNERVGCSAYCGAYYCGARYRRMLLLCSL